MKSFIYVCFAFFLMMMANTVLADVNGIKFKISVTAHKQNLCAEFNLLKDLVRDVLNSNNYGQYTSNAFFEDYVVCGRSPDVVKITKSKEFTVDKNMFIGLNNGFIQLKDKTLLQVKVIAATLNKFLNDNSNAATELLKKLASKYFPYTTKAEFSISITVEGISFDDKCFVEKITGKDICGSSVDGSNCLSCDVGKSCKSFNDCSSSICSQDKCQGYHVDVDDAGWNSAQATTIGAVVGLATITGLIFML